MTATDVSTLTVKAKQVKVGDRIDGRTVKHVIKGAKPATASFHTSTGKGAEGKGGKAMPSLTFTSNVIEIYFTDLSNPLYRWPDKEVQVQR